MSQQDDNSQDAGIGYRLPPKAIMDLIDAPPVPDIVVSPDRQWLVFMHRPSLPPISELAQPELRIGGLRIDPNTNGQSRRPNYTKLTLKHIESGLERVVVGIPETARIEAAKWSPNGNCIALSVKEENGIALWGVEASTAEARRLSDIKLNPAAGRILDPPSMVPFNWLSDGKSLVCRAIPAERGPPPERCSVPVSPVIQMTVGKKAPSRTYQDLLENPYDETLFEHYLYSQITIVTTAGKTSPIGVPGLIIKAEPSPNGRYILVETLHRPFSYLVPFFRFPTRVEVWDLDGRVVRQIAELPLAEEVSTAFDAVPTGPRLFTWRADSEATLCWVEAQDGGDPQTLTDVRDQVFMLEAPFGGEPIKLCSLSLRFSSVVWGNDGLAWVSERWWQTRWTRDWIVKPSSPDVNPRLLFDRSYEDRYSDPGKPMLQQTSSGTKILLQGRDTRTLFLVGEGASPQGNFPFLDELDLSTGETRRLWQSAAPYYEQVIELLDNLPKMALTMRESADEQPNIYIRNVQTGGLQRLTDFPDPARELTGIQRELIHYERADGIDLTATLYLPAHYKTGDGPLPTLVWAYPREFKSADAASQTTDSPYRFVRIGPGSSLFWLTQGYAILDNPAMPIIGEGDQQPNDTYIEQLVANAKAAVEEVVKRGVADPDRIAIAGHSYGAFMTANLLAHSDLFRAGIARSGAYNRTLTPFGFQSEERTFWQAPEVYFKMSPFMYANGIKDPILLIHGEADNNTGTFPIQSERFYSALKGHGATARLVLLPHESHGYQGRESVMHVMWEITEWLNRYVKNAPPRSTK